MQLLKTRLILILNFTRPHAITEFNSVEYRSLQRGLKIIKTGVPPYKAPARASALGWLV